MKIEDAMMRVIMWVETPKAKGDPPLLRGQGIVQGHQIAQLDAPLEPDRRDIRDEVAAMAARLMDAATCFAQTLPDLPEPVEGGGRGPGQHPEHCAIHTGSDCDCGWGVVLRGIPPALATQVDGMSEVVRDPDGLIRSALLSWGDGRTFRITRQQSGSYRVARIDSVGDGVTYENDPTATHYGAAVNYAQVASELAAARRDYATTDYCNRCGESPESATHTFGHAYEPQPGLRRRLPLSAGTTAYFDARALHRRGGGEAQALEVGERVIVVDDERGASRLVSADWPDPTLDDDFDGVIVSFATGGAALVRVRRDVWIREHQWEPAAAAIS